MKKLFLLAVTMLMAFAVQASALDEARIYINAGHGSWGPNDRPMATIPYPMLSNGMPDTCGFYESNTNLWKALSLGRTIVDMGAKEENLMYSRVKNGPFPYVKDGVDATKYNRNLSEICEEVDANNMDYFISIHSNAASDGSTANFPILLYRGKDGGDDYADGSYDAAKVMWDYINSNGIDVKSHYTTAGSTNIRGDIDFMHGSSDRVGSNGVVYTGYYGVLKHGTPGYISEGYFHTYQPARHRALNKDYCDQEGVRYARGIAAYYGNADGENVGYIMGTIKDKYELMNNSLFTYAIGSDDQYLPLNGATVNLYKDGTLVDTYNCDQNYNGVFVFDHLEAGADYTLDYTCDGYKATEDEYKEAVEVKANETTYVKAFLVSESYIPPVAPEIVYENYPNPEQDGDIALGDKYLMGAAGESAIAAELEGKTIRRSILRNGELYILAVDADAAPYLYVVNPEDGAVVKTLSTDGTQGEIYALSDIAFTADDVLIGCNMQECQFYPEGTFRVYKWDDLDAAPVEWFTSQKSGNYFNANVGNTLAVTGDSKNCTIITAAKTISSGYMRILYTSIVDGVKGVEYRNQDTAYSTANWGEDYKFIASPRGDKSFIVDGSLTTPVEYTINPADVGIMTLEGQISEGNILPAATGANYFKYAGKAVMVTPNVDAEGVVIGAKLFDVTNGLSKAAEIAIADVDFGSASADYAMAAATVDNADINIYLQKDSKVNKYSTKGVAQPVNMSVAAYNLAATETADACTFTFKATGDAKEYKVIVTDADGVATTVAGGAAVMGDNSVTVNKSDLPYADELSWAVELTNDKVTSVAKLNADDAQYNYDKVGGIAVDNNPESDKFGQFYIAVYGGGFHAYDINWNRINNDIVNNNYPFKALFRMDVAPNGKAYAGEWNDANAGVYMFDPEEMTTKNIFEVNPNKAGSGLYTTADGTQIGGSTTSIYFMTKEDKVLMYTFDEDYTASGLGKGNNVLVYEMGDATDEVDFAPIKAYPVAGKMLNGSCQVVANEEGGVWVSQTRYAPNNTSDVPSFIYANADGEIVYNSGASVSEYLNGTYGSGFSISPDGKTFVINNSSEFVFFDLTWSEGVPTLTYKYSYKHDLGASIFQIDFDYAGNMYAAGANVGIYAIPAEDNSVMTAAKATIKGQVMEIVAPTQAAIEDNGDETVTLTWVAPATEFPVAYNIYVNDELEAEGVTFEADAELSYVLDIVAGDATYAVSAVYPNGEESEKASTEFSSVEGVEAVTLSIYPNPTTGIVNIAAGEEVESVQVYSISGALVGKYSSESINVSNLAAGTYFIKVNDLAPVRIIKK